MPALSLDTSYTQQINTGNQSLIRALLQLPGKGAEAGQALLPFMSDKCKPVERLQIYTAQQTAEQGWALNHRHPEPSRAVSGPAAGPGFSGSCKAISEEKREEKVPRWLFTRPASLRECNH